MTAPLFDPKGPQTGTFIYEIGGGIAASRPQLDDGQTILAIPASAETIVITALHLSVSGVEETH